MNQSDIINLTAQAMILVLMLSMPPILVATFVGLGMSLIQALTQVQEQTLGFAIKLFCIVIVLSLSAYWIGGQLLRFSDQLFSTFPILIKK